MWGTVLGLGLGSRGPGPFLPACLAVMARTGVQSSVLLVDRWSPSGSVILGVSAAAALSPSFLCPCLFAFLPVTAH